MRVHEDVHVGEGQGRFSVKSQMAADGERIRFGDPDNYANWLEVRRLPNGKYEIITGGAMCIEPQNSHIVHVTMRKGSTPFRRAEFPRNWRKESSRTDVNVRPC